jgi:hypothetical protein
VEAAPSSTKPLYLSKTGVLLLPSFRNYSIDLHCKLRETVRCLLPARGADCMAHDDGPFEAARREIALHAAAHNAQPAGSPRESGAGVPAMVGGIPIASAMLLPADHLDAESAWNQHIPFAFWLVQAHGPAIFVEFGTFRGTSYFHFVRRSRRCGCRRGAETDIGQLLLTGEVVSLVPSHKYSVQGHRSDGRCMYCFSLPRTATTG